MEGLMILTNEDICMKQQRGFVTLASGNIKYYKFAYYLLLSYRLKNDKYPFAIICDRENEYTAAFDDVVVLDDLKSNYLDKFRILTDSPYEESIFIEPDCLIYRNIDHFFDILSKEYDFTSFGWNDVEGTCFNCTEKMVPEFGEKIRTTPMFCPGYLFIRKSEVCQNIYNDVLRIADWLMKYGVQDCPELLLGGKLRDDPLFFLAMRLNDCECVAKPSVGKCIALPSVKKIKRVSIEKGQLDVVEHKEYNDCALLHFSTRKCTEEGLYWQQCISTSLCCKNAPHFLIAAAECGLTHKVLHLLKKVKYSFIHRVLKK